MSKALNAMARMPLDELHAVRVHLENEHSALGFDKFWDYLELTPEEFEEKYKNEEPLLTPNEREHGRCIEVRQEAYGDRYVYEDGYEEFYDIGD